MVDGTGALGRVADVAITGDKIVAVGELSSWNALKVIDASGLVVSPGFIDMHTHSDLSILQNPDQVSMLFQGVTSQVVSNCGMAMGQIINSPKFEFEQKWLLPFGVQVNWSSAEEHLRLIEEQGTGTNYVPLAGHGTIRKRVLGFEPRPPDQNELEQMKALVEEAFDAGVWGLSTGLEYPPASFARTDEIIELAKVAGRRGGFYTTHLRSEGDKLIESVQEALVIAKEGNMPLQLSHHKADGKRNWGKINTTLGIVDKERAKGMDILLDAYPYLAYQTSLAVAFLPDWVKTTDPKDYATRLTDPDYRPRILNDMKAENTDWSRVVIGNAQHHRYLQGHMIFAAAGMMEQEPEEFVLDLLADEHGFVSAGHFSLSEEDVQTVLKYPHTMIGSDAIGTLPDGPMSAERPHPRSYGTFPRIFANYVKETPLLTLEDAVRKMTSLPAQRLGWTDRGILKPDAYADLVIFNFETFRDISTFEDPHRLSEGVQYLFVNGGLTISEGQMTGERSGRVLRKTHS